MSGASNGEGSSVCRFGSYELDRTTLELKKSGRKLKLAPQPARVLGLLASRPGELVSRDEIRRELWGEQTFVDFERGLNYCINCIRSVLGDDAQRPRYVETLARRGYRFVCEVTQAEPLAERSLAVLPFENLNGDPEQDFLADGMADALITELGKSSSMRVISRQSILQFKSSQSSLPDIARRLRVGLLVEGTVLRDGNRLRITAQLIQAQPERHLWAEAYECRLDNLLALQMEIGRAISAAIHGRLAPSVAAERPGPSPVKAEAHVAYLKGRYHLGKHTAQSFQKALECFREASAIDPGYAPPLAGLAHCYVLLGFWGHLPEPQAFPIAKEAALKALALDDSLSRAHGVAGLVRWWHDWDPMGAESELRRAIELNPSDPEGHIQHATFLSLVRLRGEQAIAEARVAMDLDPLSLFVNTRAAWVSFYAGRCDLAVAQAHQVLELFPDSLHALYVLGQVELSRSRFAEAAVFFEKALRIAPDDPIAISYVGHAQALAGNRAAAQRALDILLAKAQERYVIPRSMLWIYTGLGDVERAFSLLEEQFEARSSFLWWLRSAPFFETIRSDPRYDALVRRMGFPAA